MKLWKRIILFFAMFIVVYLGVCVVLTPKTKADKGGDKFFAGRGFEAEAKNTIEVVGIGNSDLYSAFNPLELYRLYGITSYCCGVAKASPMLGYRLLQDITKKQQIKVCIVETDFLYEKMGMADYTQSLIKLQFLASPFIYHARWKNLKWQDFTKLPKLDDNYDELKGFKYSNKRYNYQLKNYMGSADSEARAIPKKSLQYLEKIRKLCERKGIQLLFVEMPSPSSWNYAKSYGVQAYANEHHIEFIDYNIHPEYLDFDFKTDFRDKGNHLNIYGSIKVAKHLGGLLEKYQLTDHRKTQKIWEKEVKDYEDLLFKNHISIA